MDAGRNQDQKEWEKGIRIMMAKMTQSSCTESADQQAVPVFEEFPN